MPGILLVSRESIGSKGGGVELNGRKAVPHTHRCSRALWVGAELVGNDKSCPPNTACLCPRDMGMRRAQKLSI